MSSRPIVGWAERSEAQPVRNVHAGLRFAQPSPAYVNKPSIEPDTSHIDTRTDFHHSVVGEMEMRGRRQRIARHQRKQMSSP